MLPTHALLLVLQSGGGLPPFFGLLLQIVAIIAIFYFVMLRPQQRQRHQHEDLLRNIKKGDEVVTAGGIVGEVVHVKETVRDGKPERTMEDRVTIKSGESRLVVERGRIARVVSAASTSASTPAA
jgi:preprotein translocase subunit YajC